MDLVHRVDQQSTGCQLSMILLREGYQQADDVRLLYPFNSLRNYALLLVSTGLAQHTAGEQHVYFLHRAPARMRVCGLECVIQKSYASCACAGVCCR
jgi:hypothetical protein